MAEPKVEDKPEDNRSPETEEAAELDLEAVAEAVVEKLKPLLEGGAGKPPATEEEAPPEVGTTGGDGASQTPPSLGGDSESPPPASSDSGSLDERIAAGVRKALGDKDHEAQHAAMTPQEKPDRKGIARYVFGLKR